MRLDTPTLLLVSTLLSLMLSGMWIGLSLDRHRTSGLRDWGLSLLGFCLGTVALALRGVLPELLSIDLANLLLLVALGSAWRGARRFDDRPAPVWPMLAAGAVWVGLRALPDVTVAVEARVIIMSALSTPLLLATAVTFWRGRGDALVFRGFLAAAFALNGLLVLLRIPAALLQPSWTYGPVLPDALYPKVIMLQSILHGIATSFALLAMFRERGERRALAAAAVAREAAEQASLAKSRFLARMSHELRTPLNGVLGLTQVLAARGDLPPGAAAQLAVMDRAGQHLLALVNDALDLAQVEAGRLTLERAPVPLRALLDGAVALVQGDADARRIALRVEAAPDCPPAVLGDARRLRQVLLNLLGNAVKFTPAGGWVRLSLGPLPGQGLRFEVVDSGPGIPPAQRDLLFKEFSRLPQDRLAAAEGAGLGLAISAGLVQAMGGRIGVAGGPEGRGSRFWVEVPLSSVSLVPAEAGGAEPGLARAVLPAGGLPPLGAGPSVATAGAAPPRRVLVVDDVAVNRMVAQALLEAEGHQVQLAESGEAALQLLQSGAAVDVVLLDLQLPGMDGLETARRLRAARTALPGPVLTILALSASAGPELAAECRAAGMDGYLAKPVDRRLLLATLRDLPRG